MTPVLLDAKAWVLKRDWTDVDFQDGASANKQQLQVFEDLLVDRLRRVCAREMGVGELPDLSVRCEQRVGNDASAFDVLARELEPIASHSTSSNLNLNDVRKKVLCDPEVLGSSLDIVGAYLKNYEVDKAGCVIETVLPACRERGGLWLLKALNFLATVRMKQARPSEALGVLREVEAYAGAHLRPEEFDEAWEFWETVYRNFGWISSSLGHDEDAIAYAQRALDAKGRVGKPASWFDYWDIGRMKASISLKKDEMGSIKASQAMVTQALWLHRDAEPSDLVMRAKIWHSVGECSFALGHLSEGSSPRVATPNGAATGAEALGHYRKALKCFKESHKLFLKTEGRYNPLTGSEAESVAWTLLKLGSDEEAKDFLLDALEAASLQQNGWGDGTQLAPALAHAMQGVERILEVHRRSSDREGLRRYFSSVERLCSNISGRLVLTKKHPDAATYERLVSSCAMVMVASGTDEGTSGGQKLLQGYLWENPMTTQAQLCHKLLFSIRDGLR